MTTKSAWVKYDAQGDPEKRALLQMGVCRVGLAVFDATAADSDRRQR